MYGRLSPWGVPGTNQPPNKETLPKSGHHALTSRRLTPADRPTNPEPWATVTNQPHQPTNLTARPTNLSFVSRRLVCARRVARNQQPLALPGPRPHVSNMHARLSSRAHAPTNAATNHRPPTSHPPCNARARTHVPNGCMVTQALAHVVKAYSGNECDGMGGGHDNAVGHAKQSSLATLPESQQIHITASAIIT